ncbi:MAG TPA: molecular chaperone TorD family protein [Casimicrobiaceae bacterium]|nr:molecular chaperone TorD family protein [Casimicrobiaceae bacterium]
MESAPLVFVHAIEPEDRARADFYAVLATLFRDAPTAQVLQAIAAAGRLPEAASGVLPARWNRLVDACGAMDVEAARQEYWELFVGVGKCEINLHASHWQTGFMMEKPLVELRHDLARLGLGRKPESELLEDHLASLCETMRLLIEGGPDRRPSDIATQQQIFERHLLPWVPQMCAVLTQNELANFYRPVGEFTDAFVAIERDSFAIA